MRGVAAVEDRIAGLDHVEGRQDGLPRHRVAVVAQPLDLADPDHHPSEFGSIGVDLDPPQRARPKPGRLPRHPEAFRGPLDDLVLQVLEYPQGEVQEVPGAAGGVEHSDRAQARQQRLDLAAGCLQHGGVGAVRAIEERRHRGLRLRHLAAKGHQHGRLHQALDGRPVGVVGPQLGALVGVQAALEEGAEDGRLDIGPVELGGVADHPDLVGPQLDGGGRIEEAAIEPVDPVGPEGAALGGHHREEAREARVEGGRVGVQVLHQARHEALGQETGVLGEEAEEDPIEEVRYRGGVDVPLAQAAGQACELAGRLLGDLRPHEVRAQAVGVAEESPQLAQRLRRSSGQVGQAEGVHPGGRVGEARVDLDAVHVRDHQQGRAL